MGCDIHSFVAVLGDDGTLSPSETYVSEGLSVPSSPSTATKE